MSPDKTATIVPRLLAIFKPYWMGFLAGLMCRAVMLGTLIATTYLWQRAIDEIVSGRAERLWLYVLTGAALVITSNVALYFAGLLSVSFSTQVTADLRRQMGEHIHFVQLQTLAQHQSGDLLSRIDFDIEQLQSVLREAPNKLLQPVLFAIGIVYLASISWQLLLLSSLLMPIASIVSDRLAKPVEASAQVRSELHGRAASIIGDTIGGMAMVKSFNLQSALSAQFDVVLQSIERASIALERMRSGLSFVNLCLGQIPQLVVPVLGGYLVTRGEMTVGELLAFNSLGWFVFRAVQHGLELRVQWASIKPVMHRLVEILDLPLERDTGALFVYLPTIQAPAIVFDCVDFTYPASPTAVERQAIQTLSDISFSVDAGQSIAVVGVSGSGKSTLLKLICGLCTPSAGTIQLFGQDLEQIELASARGMIALVSQEAHLFPVSISENIGYGRPSANFDDIVAAAKAAYAHDFIMRMPDGYGTVLAEFGTSLSGGQRQRIALARAILKDAPILLLDEPTAALDTESEQILQAALAPFMRGRTCITVAHRLSTIQHADEILLIDNGRIAERGRHLDLLEYGSVYPRLYKSQLTEVQHG